MTSLEIAIMERLAKSNSELNSILTQLVVSKREYSGAGSFTHFQELKEPLLGYPDLKRQTLDEIINLPELEFGIGAFLEITNGSPDMLEIYTFGDERWSGDYSEFNFG